jgi:hypothetical protein
MADIQKNLNSQADFIKEIDKPHLGEFLCRFKTTNGSSVLSRMILNELRAQYPSIFTQYTGLQIRTIVNESPRYTNPPDIYTLIEFTNKTPVKLSASKSTKTPKMPSNPQYDYTKIGHITFHLVPSQCGNNIGSGPIHVINDRSTRRVQRVRVTQKHNQSCSQYTLSISTPVIPNYIVKQDMHELSIVTLNVLSRWFEDDNPDNPYNIKYNLCTAQAKLNTDNALHKILKWKKRGGTRRKL